MALAALSAVLTIGGVGCYRPDAVDCVVGCGVAGACPSGMACSNGFCAASGTCAVAGVDAATSCEACGPSALDHARCRGNVVLTCDGTNWTPGQTCSGDSPICAGGSCRQCRPGTSRCQAGCIQPCDSAGAWTAVGSCTTCLLSSASVQLAAGWGHTCAIVAGGRVQCWGDGRYGQLGLGGGESRGGDQRGLAGTTVDLGAGRTAVAIAAGGRHTCALLDTSMVKCWGDNGRGQLGLGDVENRGDDLGEMGDALPAIDLGVGRTARAIVAGGEHSCAILDDGQLKCWGANDFGQLGLGDTAARGDDACEMGVDLPAVNLGRADATVASVIAGAWHTCAILSTGEVMCWGDNEYSQLGLGDTRDRGDGVGALDASATLDFGAGRQIVALAAGDAHTCALDSNGAATCWGQNGAGQLGLENRTNWSDALDPGDLSVHLSGVIAQIVVGSYYSCARFATGAVKCWGLDTFGQLGLGVSDNRGDDPGEMGDHLPAVDLGANGATQALSLVAGGDHTCAVIDTDQVKCWGLNQHGELGIGDTQTRGNAPAQMGDALPTVPF